VFLFNTPIVFGYKNGVNKFHYPPHTLFILPIGSCYFPPLLEDLLELLDPELLELELLDLVELDLEELGLELDLVELDLELERLELLIEEPDPLELERVLLVDEPLELEPDLEEYPLLVFLVDLFPL